MADEIPPAPSESADDVAKSETIRITLPPKSEQPVAKRETVRINVPNSAIPPLGASPKKESSKLSTSSEGSVPNSPPPAPVASQPLPPAPKPPTSVTFPAAKPVSGLTPPPAPPSPPKPPSLGGARPTVPLRPASAVAPAPTPPPGMVKPATPKKETARITLPSSVSKPSLPKATVKMQSTQPLVNRPQSSIQAAPVMQQAAPAPLQNVAAADGAVNPLSIAALILSLGALATVYMAYQSAMTAL